MKKTTKVFAALAGAILALSLASCNEKKSAASSPEGSHAKVTIKFPTAGASGALYAVGAASLAHQARLQTAESTI